MISLKSSSTALMKGIAVLITGGAGFIGSHLAEQLVQAGAQVTILDNLSTGSLDNIAAVAHAIRFIHGDIRDHEALETAMQGQEIIFHCAAYTSVAWCEENPADAFAVNVTSTLAILQMAVKHGCKRVIFSSSAAVYGLSNMPCVETQLCNPISVYGYSKLIGEQLCTWFTQTYGIVTVALRYFNVYGPRMHSNVVARFRYAMEHNEPITLYGTGMQVRDFVLVTQVVQANCVVACADAHLVSGQQFNVATGSSISLLQLLDQLKQEFPAYAVPIQVEPARAGDIDQSYADCSKWQRVMS
ncbi:MAG: SDR family NAD(P)-dependent oxidoreductase [Candidatus Babeliales bacterium]